LQTALTEEVSRIEELPARAAGDLLLLIVTVLAILTLAFCGIFFWLNHPMLIFPDQALYVHMAKLYLQGKMPYVEMFDNNPPLAFYLQIFPVCLAGLLHIAEPLAFSLYIWALILLSSTVSGIVLWRSASRGALYVGMAAILGLVFFCQQQRLDFGQREHIFAILYFPFFILRYLRWQGLKIDRPAAIFIGIMAGVGISLKHYFLLVAFAPELVWAIEKRALRPFFRAETVALAATILLYLAHFLFLPRAESDFYFRFIMPLYQAGYSYYTTSMAYNLNTYWRGDFHFMALTTLAALTLARQSSLVLPLQAFSLMSALIFILAGQVWSYHVLPVRLANDVALFVQAFLFCRCLPAFIKGGKRAPLFLGLVIIAFTGCQAYTFCRDIMREHEVCQMFFLPSLGYDGECPQSDIDPFTEIVADQTARDDSILFISSSMSPGYPVYLQSRRKPASRFLHAMILPVLAFIIDNKDEANKDLYKKRMRQILDWYGEDIAKNRPKLVFVQSKFIYDLLNQRDFFGRQMANYKLLQVKDDNRVYVRDK
jgi:hypothetical protein